MSSATTPSVGRILHYWPHPEEFVNWHDKTQPLPCQIVYVHTEKQLVNVHLVDQAGIPHFRSRVAIGEQVNDGRRVGRCEWMPYQKQVAAGEAEPTRHA